MNRPRPVYEAIEDLLDAIESEIDGDWKGVKHFVSDVTVTKQIDAYILDFTLRMQGMPDDDRFTDRVRMTLNFALEDE